MITVDFSDFKINLKYGTKVVEVTVDPDNMVESLRSLIKEKLGLNEGDAYTMKKNGVALDGSITINAAGIKAGETVTIDYGEISIKVKTP
jgi:hypothetical protein